MEQAKVKTATMCRRRWTVSLLVAGSILGLLQPPAQAAFPGRNGLLAYARQVNGVGHLFVIHPNGTGRRRITSGPASDDAPTWSPNGSWIAFTRRDPSTGKRAVYVVRR